MEQWLCFVGSIAAAEPTIVGEIALTVGAIAIGVYLGVGLLYDSIKNIQYASDRKQQDLSDKEELDKNGKPVVRPGQQPTEKDGYTPPKSGPKKGKAKNGKTGWVDSNGNVWVPQPTDSSGAHGGGHWDVQSPGGGYSNVYPGGKTRGGLAPFPKIPLF